MSAVRPEERQPMTVVAWEVGTEYDKKSYRKIKIDGLWYLSTTPITVAHLMAARGRDSTYQFFHERHGDGPDTLLLPTDVLDLNDDEQFYAIPHCTFSVGPASPVRPGYVLAMAVLQSNAWENADDELRAAVAHFTAGSPVRDPAPPKLDEEQAEADAYDLFWKALDAEAKVWNVDRNAVIAIAAALTEPFKRLWAVRAVRDPSPPDVVTLAENFLADEKIWPLGANKAAQRCVRGFAAWLRGELEVGVRGAGVVPPEEP